MANTNIYDPLAKTYTAGTPGELAKSISDIQYKGVTPIAVDALMAPTSGINIPTPPVNTTDYSGIINGGNAQIAGNSNFLQSQIPKNTLPDSVTQIFDRYSSLALPNKSELYNQAYNESGKAVAESNAINSQKNLGLLQSKLAGITAEGQAGILNQENRLASMGAVSGAQQDIQRQAAIRSLPVQAEVLAAQAMATGDQNTLKAAQDRLDTVFKIKSDEADSNFNYQVKLIDTAMSMATEQQKQQLQDMKDKQSLNQQDKLAAIGNAQALSKALFDSGNFENASAITSIPFPDPTSPTFAQDVTDYNKKVAAVQAKAVNMMTPIQQLEYSAKVNEMTNGTLLTDAQLEKYPGLKYGATTNDIIGRSPITPEEQVRKTQNASDVQTVEGSFNTVDAILSGYGITKNEGIDAAPSSITTEQAGKLNESAASALAIAYGRAELPDMRTNSQEAVNALNPETWLGKGTQVVVNGVAGIKYDPNKIAEVYKSLYDLTKGRMAKEKRSQNSILPSADNKVIDQLFTQPTSSLDSYPTN